MRRASQVTKLSLCQRMCVLRADHSLDPCIVCWASHICENGFVLNEQLCAGSKTFWVKVSWFAHSSCVRSLTAKLRSFFVGPEVCQEETLAFQPSFPIGVHVNSFLGIANFKTTIPT